MPEKSPEAYSFITYGWVFALAILGGVVSFMRKLQEGHTRVFNLVEFIGEIVTSAFAAFNIDQLNVGKQAFIKLLEEALAKPTEE